MVFLRQVVGTGLQVINTAVSGLMAQADAALTKEPDKVAQLMAWLNQQIPGMGWGLAVFTVLALVVAAIAKLTGNLDNIFSFVRKYFGKAGVNLTEPELSMLRQKLLKQMKTDVALRLNDSLHNLVRVDLEQAEQRHQIGRRTDSLVTAEPKQTQPLKNFIRRGLAVFSSKREVEPVAPAEKTYSIFHRADIGGRLLILGEPGAGKTTELLTVAQRLVEAAIDDSDQPIPILFELSSWTPGTPILMWLAQQLQRTYGVSKKLATPLAQQWIQQTRILPLWDGLDELGQRNQIACIEALEGFLAQHRALSAIVCCRREEYEQGGQQLKQLKGAIYLQAVGAEQIQQYLKDLGREQLWSDIQSQPELLNLARSPLFLTLLVVAYQEQSIQDKETLFNAYIQKQLHEPSHQGAYKPGKGIAPEKALRYLGWLAIQLKKKQETEFLIENLQPDWLASKQQKLIYRLIGGLIVGSILGLIVGLILGLIYGLILGLSAVQSFGRAEIDPKEQLKWASRNELIYGLIYGLILGSLTWLILGLLSVQGAGLLYGLSLGLGLGSYLGLVGKAIEQKQVSNQGIKKSIQNGLIVGLIIGLIVGLSVGLSSVMSRGLLFGLFFGLSFGLLFGLDAAIQHFILRIILTKNGYTPWNYALFLEHAAQHRFIQRTGGRYRFIHDLLREHFAQMTPQQQAILAQPPRDHR